MANRSFVGRMIPNKKIDDLIRIGRELADLEPRLSSGLNRFAGYHARFVGALTRARNGDPSWVTKVREDSCHTVWMELHEDLVATLGLERGPG